MNISPEIIDGELPQDIRNRHAALVVKINAAQKKRQSIETERSILTGQLADRYTSATVEKVRKLGNDLCAAMQEEIDARGELDTWLDDCLPAANALHQARTERLAQTTQKIVEKLVSIGFNPEGKVATPFIGYAADSPTVLKAIAGIHPEVVDASRLAKEAGKFASLLLEKHAANGPHEFNKRVKMDLAGKLQAQLRHTEEHLASL